MIENLLEKNEKIILDFTPDNDKLKNIYKMNTKLPKYCFLVFILVMILLVIVSGGVHAIIPLALVFVPTAVVISFVAKGEIISSENAIYEKYIVTNKRILIFNTDTNSGKYIYLYNINSTTIIGKNSISFSGYDDNERLITLKFRNLNNVKEIVSVIEEQKRHIVY